MEHRLNFCFAAIVLIIASPSASTNLSETLEHVANTKDNDFYLEKLVEGERSDNVTLTREDRHVVVSKGMQDGVSFLEEELPDIKNLTLKHYLMSYSVPFYPPWTYSGFYSPREWHLVPIEYFTHPNDTKMHSLTLRQHESAMGLCTDQVVSIIKRVEPPFKDKKEQCWGTILNECTSYLPSPIEIISEEAKENHNLTEFEFSNYNQYYPMIMYLPEDGTDLLTLKFITQSSGKGEEMREVDPPGVSRGSVGDHEVFLDRIVFRVGFDKDAGSEHIIDGSMAGMELQLYFTPKNVPYWEALAQYRLMPPDDPRIGYNVHAFSILVNVTDEDVSDPSDSGVVYFKKFDVLSKAAKMLWRSRNPKWRRAIQFNKSMMSLENILDVPLLGKYYLYEGSMTHPPCLPNVMWTVFETPLTITYEQWKTFSLIHSEFSDDKYLAGNIRPLHHIFVKVDVDTYGNMKEVYEQGNIAQSELDLGMEDGERLRRHKIALFLTRYDKYKRYFAQKVLIGRRGRKMKRSEYDYYELAGEMGHGVIKAPVFTSIILMATFVCIFS